MKHVLKICFYFSLCICLYGGMCNSLRRGHWVPHNWSYRRFWDHWCEYYICFNSWVKFGPWPSVYDLYLYTIWTFMRFPWLMCQLWLPLATPWPISCVPTTQLMLKDCVIGLVPFAIFIFAISEIKTLKDSVWSRIWPIEYTIFFELITAV